MAVPRIQRRADQAQWITPTINDVLDIVSPTNITQEQIVANANTLKSELAERGIQIDDFDYADKPYHTRYKARLNTDNHTTQDLYDVLKSITTTRRDWIMAYDIIPDETESAYTIMIWLRTAEHRPLVLRQALTQGRYRTEENRLAIVLGNALHDDWKVQPLQHVHIIGQNGAKYNFIRSMLLTLTLVNTPAELRIGTVSNQPENYHELSKLPHTLGSCFTDLKMGKRLLFSLLKESQRRKEVLQSHKQPSLSAYNKQLASQNKVGLPHILLIWDASFKLNNALDVIATLQYLVQHGMNVGVQLVITSESHEIDDKFKPIITEINTTIITRAASQDYASTWLKGNLSLLPFIDAFVKQNSHIIPIELCTTLPADLTRLTNSWTMLAEQRKRSSDLTFVSNKTGVTELLWMQELSTDQTTDDVEIKATPATPKAQAAIQTSAKEALPDTQELKPTPSNVLDQQTLLRAQALATYLGWLGRGPLQDVLGLSQSEAEAILEALQEQAILEDSASPTPRILPASPPPKKE